MEPMANRPALLVLVRHAESARNAAKKNAVYFADEDARRHVKGIADYKTPITEEGLRQAEQAGQHIRARFGEFDYAYHSGYARTIQTLDGLLKAYSEEERQRIKVRMNSFIRERDPGYAFDMTEVEAETAFPWLREYWTTFGGYFARPPGGEGLVDVTSRVHTFLDTLYRDRAGKKVLVVTHGGTLRCFRVLLERWDYDQALGWPPGQRPKNCGVTAYRFDAETERPVLEDYNWTGE